MSILEATLKEAVSQICEEEIQENLLPNETLKNLSERIAQFIQDLLKTKEKSQETLERLNQKEKKTQRLSTNSSSQLYPTLKTQSVPLSDQEKRFFSQNKKWILLFFFLSQPFLKAQTTFEVQKGFLAIQSHVFQSSENNSRFDYVNEGGQNNLFPYSRYEILFEGETGHKIRFLANPLTLETNFLAERELSFDSEIFLLDQSVKALYLFPFYRGTYEWPVIQSEKISLFLGGGLQIRNFRAEFSSLDGENFFYKQNVGPVPLLSLGAYYQISDKRQIQFQMDGFWANLPFLNGGLNPIEGALLDTSLNLSEQLSKKWTILFFSRYLTGGSKGTSKRKQMPKDDGFTENWLDLFAFGTGLRYQPSIE